MGQYQPLINKSKVNIVDLVTNHGFTQLMNGFWLCHKFIWLRWLKKNEYMWNLWDMFRENSPKK